MLRTFPETVGPDWSLSCSPDAASAASSFWGGAGNVLQQRLGDGERRLQQLRTHSGAIENTL